MIDGPRGPVRRPASSPTPRSRLGEPDLALLDSGVALVLAVVLAFSLALAPRIVAAREPSSAGDSPSSAPPKTAATPTVLVLPIVSEGLASGDQRALLTSLSAAFEHEQLGRVEPSEHEPCADEACLRELGRAHAASHVIQVRVEADGRDYAAALTVVAVDATGPANVIDAGCEICGLAEFEDRLAARAVAARDLILAAPRLGRVELVGAPAEAHVRIDGRVRGRLPVRGRPPLVAELPVGEHELRVRADGYYPERVPIESRAGVTQRLEIGLEPKPLTRWQRPTGWALVGAGAASLTAGFALIGVHGSAAGIRCRADEPGTIDADGDCRWLRQTRGTGIALAILGAAGTVAGASLLIIDAQRRRAQAATAQRAQLRLRVGWSPVAARLALDLRF